MARTAVAAAVDELDEWHVANAFASELAHVQGAAGSGGGTASLTRRALKAEGTANVGATARTDAVTPTPATAADLPELVVCPSGNLALVFFPHIDGRADLETLNDIYPDMVDALANHPGVGVVMVRSAVHGPLAIGKSGVRHLASGKVDDEDPLKEFDAYAAQSLVRLDGMSNCGDLVLVSMLFSDTSQVAAFEELIGSHGGLGGPQTQPLLLYPSSGSWNHSSAHRPSTTSSLAGCDKQPRPNVARTSGCPAALAESRAT